MLPKIDPYRSCFYDRDARMTPDPSPPPPPAVIVWRTVDGPDLIEARLVRGDALPLYCSYVARAPGAREEEWRGYVGINFLPVGVGTCAAMQAAVEWHAWAVLRAGDHDKKKRTGEGDYAS